MAIVYGKELSSGFLFACGIVFSHKRGKLVRDEPSKNVEAVRKPVRRSSASSAQTMPEDAEILTEMMLLLSLRSVYAKRDQVLNREV